MTGTGRFQGSLLTAADSVMLVLRGELDLATATSAEALVDRALAEPADAYVLDLADLTYMDARGVRPLVRLADMAAMRGATTVARYPCQSAEVVLALTPITVVASSGKVEERPGSHLA